MWPAQAWMRLIMCGAASVFVREPVRPPSPDFVAFLFIGPVQAPLPHVAGQIHQPIGAGAVRVHAYRRGGADVAFRDVAPGFVPMDALF